MFGLKHSPSGYKLDECISSVQKSIRRCEPEKACFFSFQLISGGFGNYLMSSLLATIVCEDVGFGCVRSVRFLMTQYASWKKTLEMASLGIGKSCESKKAVKIALDTVSRLALMSKSRLAATASGFSFALQKPSQEIAQSDQHKKWTGVVKVFDDALGLGTEGKDDGREEQVLFLANIIYSCHVLKVSTDVLAKAWGVLIRRAREQTETPMVARFVSDIYSLSRAANMKPAGRLCFFESCLLVVRGDQANLGKLPEPWKHLDNFVKKHFKQTKRSFSVPDHALDKHTQRGKGTSTLSRLEQVGTMFPELKVSEWSKEETAKSHGDGCKLSENVTEMSHFFDIGAVVNNERMKDPYFVKCREWYMKNEAEFGYRKAKTKFMTERQEWMNNFLVDTFGFEERDLVIPKKPKKTKKRKSSSSNSSSKSSSSTKKPKLDRKEAENSGTSDATNSKIVKKKKRKSPSSKKKKSPTRKKKTKAERVQEEKEISEYLSSLKMKKLSVEDVQKIKDSPLGQYIAGPTKRGIYQQEKHAWKGPYDILKAGQALKVAFMIRRVPFMESLGVHTPDAKAFCQKDDENIVWIRFPQLSEKPKREWKITERNGFKIVDRNSMEIVQGHKMDPKIWEENVDVLGEMICALSARYLTKVVTGDSHLVNLLYVDGHIQSIDIEEKRSTYPEHIFKKDIDGDVKMNDYDSTIPWNKYLFALGPQKKAKELMEKGMNKHKKRLLEILGEFDKKCVEHLDEEQLHRWKFLFSALRKVVD